MISIMKSSFLLSALFAAPSLAQQAIYQQCGGKQWTGGTTCVAGTTCQVQNEWYSQCLPSPAKTTTTCAKNHHKTTLTTSTIKPTTSSSSSSSAPNPTASTGTISQTSGTQFIVDGQRGYFVGTNAYWIGFLTSNADVDGVFSQLQQSGLKILRIWGFNTVNSIPTDNSVYYQALIPDQAPIINTGPNGLQRLDYVVQSAAAHGIKLIISLVNNWSDYGGIPAYNTYFSTTSQTWYTSSTAQSAYRAYINAVISRYPFNPAIFAWELANEPRCSGCPTTTITNWANSTSAYIKSLDSKHLVALGDEGMGVSPSSSSPSSSSYPFSTYEGVNFTANLAITTLDFGTLHLYPSPWGESSSSSFVSDWIAAHGSACAAAGKPCLLEEYGTGASPPPPGGSWTLPASNVSIEQGWQKTVLATQGFAGDCFWDLGTVLKTGERTPDDGNTVYVDDTDAWNALVVRHVEDVGLRNGF